MPEILAREIDLSDPVIMKRYKTHIDSPPARGHKPGNERSLKEFIATLENVRIKNEAYTKAHSHSQPPNARISALEKKVDELTKIIEEATK